MSSCCDRYRCRCDARLYLAISVTALIDGFLFVVFFFFRGVHFHTTEGEDRDTAGVSVSPD